MGDQKKAGLAASNIFLGLYQAQAVLGERDSTSRNAASQDSDEENQVSSSFRKISCLSDEDEGDTTEEGGRREQQSCAKEMRMYSTADPSTGDKRALRLVQPRLSVQAISYMTTSSQDTIVEVDKGAGEKKAGFNLSGNSLDPSTTEAEWNDSVIKQSNRENPLPRLQLAVLHIFDVLSSKRKLRQRPEEKEIADVLELGSVHSDDVVMFQRGESVEVTIDGEAVLVVTFDTINLPTQVITPDIPDDCNEKWESDLAAVDSDQVPRLRLCPQNIEQSNVQATASPASPTSCTKTGLKVANSTRDYEDFCFQLPEQLSNRSLKRNMLETDFAEKEGALDF